MVVYDLLVSLSKESIDVLRFVEANLAAFNQQYIFFNIQRKNSITTPLLITPQQEKISQIVDFLMDEYNKNNRRPSGPPREQPMHPLLPYQQSSDEQPMMPYQQPPGDDDQPYEQIYHKKHASQQVNTELSDYYQHILALGDEDKVMDSMLKLPEKAKRDDSDDEDSMFPIKKLTT
ncbi:pH171R [African swine fever virus]|uniref:Uncharacterized protein H171R n=1 Tax=African swine fever virus (isolate Tick/Malawi/Lil 20-1/1983) TaxID=10500 RepID=VF171_ASFM2|nr:RecName: Full=Uncharacterized protein H171R; Short=pH171R [African swine fever virus Malawi LIL 20/1]WRY69391.1 pH171R (j2R) [African swine fever virus]CAA50822.1 unnamed protein product [African swine fever virus]